MTIQRRLARSNIAMFFLPVMAAAVVFAVGFGVALALLEFVYLPRLGLSLRELHETGEQIEHLLHGFKIFLCLYAGLVVAALVLTIALTNVYLTRSLFQHISQPLEILSAGVARIRDGNLDTPIAYAEEDEFKAACDAVDEMAARLKASLEEQQRQQQKKQELIAGMSHDLKSPLTSIRAYTEALLEGVARDEAAKTRYLQTIHTKETEIEAMVARLFAFAKMDMSEYPVRMEPLCLLEAMRALTGELCDEKMEIALSIPPDLRVLADRELLIRVALNLIGNSQKYAGKKKVSIKISALVLGPMAQISFADDGQGVLPEQLPKLFDVFYRGDAARTAPGSGSGLGLAVVKKAVESMGGECLAQSSQSGGLEIVFTLKIAQEERYAEHSDH